MPITQSNTIAAVFKVDSEILTWNTGHHCKLMIFVAHAYAKDDARLLKKYYCDCQNLQAKSECLEHKQVGVKINGIYKIHQTILKEMQFYCDQTTDSGGWTVFQQRIDEIVDFFRDWEHYKQRLGNLKNEFWLGNIFTLTLQGLYPRGNKLRMDMMNAKKIKESVWYSYLHINNAVNKDTLHVNGYMSIETT